MATQSVTQSQVRIGWRPYVTTQVVNIIDADATTFITAAGITNLIQASAINTLVNDLKTYGLWSKMKAIYPFVGGSATSHKFNLKDPRDVDAAYRLVFNGGWTHTGTGALPNGSNGYANTFFTPSSNFISNENAHISVYQSQPMALSDMGGSFNSTSRTLFGANTTIIDCRLNSNETPVYVLSYNSDGKGLFTTTKNGSSQVRAYRNNTLVGTITAQNSSNPLNMFISARNGNGTPNEYESTIQKFISFGDGLTDTEASALYNSIQTYQTSLGRAVNTPVYNNGLVLNLDAGNANSYPGTGTTWFDLASGNNGTLTNGPTYDIANGGSIVFDGVNDYVGLGNTPIFGTSSFTIDMWIYLPISDYNYRAILSKRSNSNYTGFAVYRPPYTNSIGIQLASISGGPYFTTSIQLTSSSWNHISIIVDRTSKTVILYSNGIRNTSTLDITNLGDITNNSVNLNLGLEAGISNWNNKISTTKIYSRALSETEVINNFNSTRGRFGL